MGYTGAELRHLVEKLKMTHADERASKIESMLIVGVLASQNAAVHFGLSYEQFLAHIGLTKNQYWKRAQAATVCRFHPEALVMLRANEVEMSHLALIGPKITQANKKFILDGIKGASTREVKLLLSRVTLDGRVLDAEPEIELVVRVTKSQLAVLDRIRDVRSHGGHVPSWGEVMVKDAEEALKNRDPLRKAERARARASAKNKEAERRTGTSPAKGTGASPAKEASGDDVGATDHSGVSPNKSDASPEKLVATKRPRLAVPAAVKHAVWLRDEGRCTWRFADGSCCGAKAMLEMDHTEMWCRGGGHSEDNLTLRCRSHNRFAAEQELGTWFMAKWTSSVCFAERS